MKYFPGDVISFRKINAWPDQCQYGREYTVVEHSVAMEWNDPWLSCRGIVNGKTSEVSADIVNANLDDVTLVRRRKTPVVNKSGQNGLSDEDVLAGKKSKRVEVHDNKGISVFDDNNVLRMRMGGDGGLFTESKVVYTINGPVNNAPAGEPIPVFGNGEPETVIPLARDKEDGELKPIKSDGGSSTYYDIPVPDEFVETLMQRYDECNSHIKTEELIRYVFGNDFDFGTAFKSLVRAYGASKGGGKEGNDIRYECNKVVYYSNKIADIHAK